jgi:putative inorganic carbon (HCO3(-)) transporter
MRFQRAALARAAILHGPTALLCALVLWLPLPFGSVQPAGHLVLHLAAAALLVAVALTIVSANAGRSALAPALALCGVALLGLFQSLASPTPLARVLSPEHARLRAAAAEVGASTTAAGSLSLAPEQTRAAALTILALAACLWCASAVVRERPARRALAITLTTSGVFQVAFGTQSWMSGSDTIWGVRVTSGLARLRGTFVNPDHCALYLELVLAVIFAWGWWAIRHARQERAPERAFLVMAGPALAWLTVFAGIAFTGSRGGLVAAITATVAQGLLLAARQRHWRLGLAGVLTTAVTLGMLATLGVQEAFGRWLGTSGYDLTWNQRLEVYGAAASLWQRFPLLGAGLASFREAFPLVEPAGFNRAYWHAHNDWIEMLVTIGLIGTLTVLTGLFFLMRGLLQRLRDSERSENAAAALAALGALVACSIHSVLDFGLAMPANAATLAIVCGAGLAVRHLQRVDEPA